MVNKNTLLEDIAAEIGYTATSTLCGWYGGRHLPIPKNATEDHRVAKVIGPSAFNRLVTAFGGTNIFIPKDRAQKIARRNRIVFDLITSGAERKQIYSRVGITREHLQFIRRTLENDGLLPMILTEKADADGTD